MRVRGFPGFVIVAVAVVALAFSGSAATASTSNVCKLAGITKTVARKVFGPGAVASYLTHYTPTLCEVIPKDYEYKGSIEVYLYPKSAYATQLNGIYPPHVKGEHLHKLHGLGSGAVYVVSHDYSIDDVLFTAGSYTVQLQNNEAGGQHKSVYPTEKEYVVLAQAIRSHLR